MSAAAAEYLNVDLEVTSRSDLQPLAKALSRKLFVLDVARRGSVFVASFEVSGATGGTPDAAIRKLIRAIDDLPPSAMRLWNRARDRVFDVGVAATKGRGTLDLPIAAETVKAVARLRARIALTIYPPATR